MRYCDNLPEITITKISDFKKTLEQINLEAKTKKNSSSTKSDKNKKQSICNLLNGYLSGDHIQINLSNSMNSQKSMSQATQRPSSNNLTINEKPEISIFKRTNKVVDRGEAARYFEKERKSREAGKARMREAGKPLREFPRLKNSDEVEKLAMKLKNQKEGKK